MKNVDDTRLTAICAEEVNTPDFPAEDFSDLVQEIGHAANSTVSACMMAIALFNEVKRALKFRFSGSRVAIKKDSVNRALNRYLTD